MNGIFDTCQFDAIEPLASSSSISQTFDDDNLHERRKKEKCDAYINQAMNEMGGINIYDIYADVCINKPTSVHYLARLLADAMPAGLFARPLLNQPGYDPCLDNEVEIYLNRPDVQQALHANVSGTLEGPWHTCTGTIEYSRDDVLTSMLGVWDDLLHRNSIRLLVYSGDIDAIVPVIGSRKWIEGLNLDVVEKWRPWRSSTGQVAGWTQDFERGLSFATVRGAGHMVPYTQPERAMYLFQSFIHNRPL